MNFTGGKLTGTVTISSVTEVAEIWYKDPANHGVSLTSTHTDINPPTYGSTFTGTNFTNPGPGQIQWNGPSGAVVLVMYHIGAKTPTASLGYQHGLAINSALDSNSNSHWDPPASNVNDMLSGHRTMTLNTGDILSVQKRVVSGSVTLQVNKFVFTCIRLL